MYAQESFMGVPHGDTTCKQISSRMATLYLHAAEVVTIMLAVLTAFLWPYANSMNRFFEKETTRNGKTDPLRHRRAHSWGFIIKFFVCAYVCVVSVQA